jgi:hypothetical protein
MMNARAFLSLAIASAFAMLIAAPVPVAGQGGRGAGAAPAPAGPIPRRADGKPDLTGTFSGGQQLSHTVILEPHPGGFGVTAGKGLITDPASGIIPYQPWALEERNRRRDDSNGYEDPVGHCEFYDIGRVHSFAQTYQFTKYGGTEYFVINANQHQTRVVDMQRKEHLPEGIRLWLGDPIGRWEGDTMVVDSTNFNGRPRMAIGGDFYGPEAHIVERWTMRDSNTIDWTMTIDNPKVFTRPWTMTTATPMKRAPNARENYDDEDTCHEGNVDLAHLKNLYYQVHPEKLPKAK